MTGEREGLSTRVASIVDGLAGWRALLVAAGCGGLSALGYAPFHVIPAYAAGLIGLVWLLDGAWRLDDLRARAAFARGWAFGFGHFLGGFYWVGGAFLQVDGAAVLMPFAVAALPAGIALFWGAASAAAMSLWTEDARRLPVFVTALMLAELARGHLFTGFPWNLPGTIWPAGDAISQAAAFVGVYGLSALTLLAFSTPACLADSGRGLGVRLIPALAAALGTGLVWGAGAQRLETPASASVSAQAETVVVRVTDPGISQRDKWALGDEAVFQRYVDLMGDPDGLASVVVWPEGAVPSFAGRPGFLDNPDMLSALGRALGDRVLIAGVVRQERDAAGQLVAHNSAAVLDGVGGVVRIGQISDKHHLVPFGEYMPFWSLYSDVPLAPLQMIGRGFTPGPRPERLVIPGAPPAAALICYESIFPGYTPRGEGRPEWIAMVTNDAWFGGQTGPYQHFNQSRYRAIEEGLPIARAAAGGISGIVDGFGRTVVATPISGGAVEAPLPPALEETPFARYGGWLLAGLLLLIAALRITPPGGPVRGLSS